MGGKILENSEVCPDHIRKWPSVPFSTLSNTVVQAIQDRKRRALLAMREDSMRYFLEPYNIVHTPLMP